MGEDSRGEAHSISTFVTAFGTPALRLRYSRRAAELREHCHQRPTMSGGRPTVMRRVLLVATLLASGVAPNALQPVETWFIFVDELHVRFMDTGRLRSLVRGIGAQLLHGGAMYSLHVSGASAVAIDFTNDLAVLESASRKLTGTALRAEDVASISAKGRGPNEITSRIDTAVAALEKALRREGPPASVLVISSGLLDSDAYWERWTAALLPLLRPDTQLFVLDPRQEDGTLHELLARGRVTLSP